MGFSRDDTWRTCAQLNLEIHGRRFWAGLTIQVDQSKDLALMPGSTDTAGKDISLAKKNS